GAPTREEREHDDDPSPARHDTFGEDPGVGHRQVGTGHPHQGATDHGGPDLREADVETDAIGRFGVLTDGAELQTCVRAVHEPVDDTGHDEGEVHHVVLLEEDPPEYRNV